MKIVFLILFLRSILFATCPNPQQPSEQNCESKIMVRAILLSCPQKDNACENEDDEIYQDTFTEDELRIKNLNHARFESPSAKYPTSVNQCKRKLLITMRLLNAGKVPTDDEFIIVDHVYDPKTKRKARLLSPVIIKLRQEQMIQLYALQFQRVVNSNPREHVFSSTNYGFKGCSTQMESPTCGVTMYDGKPIPFSEGFCCSCDPNVNMKREPLPGSEKRSFGYVDPKLISHANNYHRRDKRSPLILDPKLVKVKADEAGNKRFDESDSLPDKTDERSNDYDNDRMDGSLLGSSLEAAGSPPTYFFEHDRDIICQEEAYRDFDNTDDKEGEGEDDEGKACTVSSKKTKGGNEEPSKGCKKRSKLKSKKFIRKKCKNRKKFIEKKRSVNKQEPKNKMAEEMSDFEDDCEVYAEPSMIPVYFFEHDRHLRDPEKMKERERKRKGCLEKIKKSKADRIKKSDQKSSKAPLPKHDSEVRQKEDWDKQDGKEASHVKVNAKKSADKSFDNYNNNEDYKLLPRDEDTQDVGFEAVQDQQSLQSLQSLQPIEDRVPVQVQAQAQEQESAAQPAAEKEIGQPKVAMYDPDKGEVADRQMSEKKTRESENDEKILKELARLDEGDVDYSPEQAASIESDRHAKQFKSEKSNSPKEAHKDDSYKERDQAKFHKRPGFIDYFDTFFQPAQQNARGYNYYRNRQASKHRKTDNMADKYVPPAPYFDRQNSRRRNFEEGFEMTRKGKLHPDLDRGNLKDYMVRKWYQNDMPYQMPDSNPYYRGPMFRNRFPYRNMAENDQAYGNMDPEPMYEDEDDLETNYDMNENPAFNVRAPVSSRRRDPYGRYVPQPQPNYDELYRQNAPDKAMPDYYYYRPSGRERKKRQLKSDDPFEVAKGFYKSDFELLNTHDPFDDKKGIQGFVRNLDRCELRQRNIRSVQSEWESGALGASIANFPELKKEIASANIVQKSKKEKKSVRSGRADEDTLQRTVDKARLRKSYQTSASSYPDFKAKDFPKVKRQSDYGRVQPRGGQSCDDKSIPPPFANPETYHDSAHCLRFSDLWYSVYIIKKPLLAQTVGVQMYEKHGLYDGTTRWNDLTRGNMIRLGTFLPKAQDNLPTISMTFSPAPERTIYEEYGCIDPDNYRLLIPSHLTNPTNVNDHPEYQGGPSEYLLVPNKEISSSGGECNKVGTSFEAFARQPKRCYQTRGTCLEHQPLDMWRGDLQKRIQGERGKYFVENFGTVPVSPIKSYTNLTGDFLALEHYGPYSSIVEIEVRSDYNAMIRRVSSAQIALVYIDSSYAKRTKITLTVLNMGLTSAGFRPRLGDCPPGLDPSWCPLEGPLVTIPPQQRHDFKLDLSGVLPNDKLTCTVEVLDENHKKLAQRKIIIKKMDRCICAYHCECVCIGCSTSLTCVLLKHEEYLAAGYRGSLPVRNIYRSTPGDLVTMNLIWAALTFFYVLFLLGLAKAVVGCCKQYVALWGMGVVVGPRRICRYYECELYHCDVIYNDYGFAVHPDTCQRVQSVPTYALFLLNVFFFILYPIKGLWFLLTKCSCGKTLFSDCITCCRIEEVENECVEPLLPKSSGRETPCQSRSSRQCPGKCNRSSDKDSSKNFNPPTFICTKYKGDNDPLEDDDTEFILQEMKRYKKK